MATIKGSDPAAVLQAAVPRELIEATARETGFVRRGRDFDPVTFFWALLSSILGHRCTGIASVQREYERLNEAPVDRSSFYKHFDAEAVEFLRRLVNHACAAVFPAGRAAEMLKRFTEVLIQDSTVIALRKALAERWPGAGLPAAAKLNLIVHANGGTASAIDIAKGKKAETRFTRCSKDCAGALQIFDMGYQNLKKFAQIDHHGGFFLTRLKEGYHPVIAGSNLLCRGRAIDLTGRSVWDIVAVAQRAVIDVMINVRVKRSGLPGRPPADGHQTESRLFRVVGLRNAETGKYHLYLTNIPVTWLSAEQIGLCYSFRWEVERLFAEFKGPYDLGSWAVQREDSMLCHVYAILIAWAASRKLRAELVELASQPDILAEHLAAPIGRWALALQPHIGAIITAATGGPSASPNVVKLLLAAARDPNRGRVPLLARTRRLARNARVTRNAA